jgi:transcriptional regulator with XRE-family HTH domain
MPYQNLASPTGAIAARIILGAKLRQLRESGGIGAQQAARVIGGSGSKLSRIELGRQAARETDVVDLLNCYRVTDEAERDELLALATTATALPWWQQYAGIVDAWFLTYLGLEEVADSVQSYDTHFIPGLLQTDEYAAWLGLLRDPRPAGSFAATTTRLRELRAQRMARFSARGAQLTCVIDEAVLRRAARDPALRRAQLEHLRDIAGSTSVDVRIRPLTAGPPTAPAGFSLLRFSHPLLPDVACTEHLAGAIFIDRVADVTRLCIKMTQLLDSSASREQTPAIIERMLAES